MAKTEYQDSGKIVTRFNNVKCTVDFKNHGTCLFLFSNPHPRTCLLILQREKRRRERGMDVKDE